MKRFAFLTLALSAILCFGSTAAFAKKPGTPPPSDPPVVTLATVTVTPSTFTSSQGAGNPIHFDVDGLNPGEWVQGVVYRPDNSVVASTSFNFSSVGDAAGEWFFNCSIGIGQPDGVYTIEIRTSADNGATSIPRATCTVLWTD